MSLRHSAKNLVTALAFVLLNPDVSAAADLVTLEAESGSLGADFATDSGDPAYIYITSNSIGNNPGNASRVATYSVTFPQAGTYELYARLRVGPGTFDDDSMFFGNGFGTKNPAQNSNWIFVNGLASAGYTASNDVVAGTGNVGSLVWKWVNLSRFTGTSGFTIGAGNLARTFQIGARENGLDMDKFVFGTASSTFTVQELDNGSNSPPVIEQRDLVAGNLIQFNDNGTWSWFQDERAVVDVAGGKILIGSDASNNGTGGGPREGDVETAIFDLATGTSRRYTLKSGDSRPGVFYADDHNAPGLLVLPNGNYLAIYAGHNAEAFSYWRIFDGINWTAERSYDWSTQPGGTDFNTTYFNPHYMAAEGRI